MIVINLRIIYKNNSNSFATCISSFISFNVLYFNSIYFIHFNMTNLLIINVVEFKNIVTNLDKNSRFDKKKCVLKN